MSEYIVQYETVTVHGRELLIARPQNGPDNTVGLLWIHGGGYHFGVKEWSMVRCEPLVKKYGVVVLSPDYRLSGEAPFPAALKDCYAALLYMKEHAAELGIDPERLFVGGDSSGGGMCAAVCMLARDRGDVQIAFQFPMYPMLDYRETETSRNNHGQGWDSEQNREAWRLYLNGQTENISPYASPALQTNYAGLPPAYTLVGTGEPFYAETLAYVENLRRFGVEAQADVYDTDIHGFDTDYPELAVSQAANKRFYEVFAQVMTQYRAPQCGKEA